MDPVMAMPPQRRPVRILSLDGDLGAANPFGQIRILRALMEEIWKRENPDREPTLHDIDEMLPHKYFDLIVGTGTGGILAVYLGRFRLTIKECQDAYEELVEEVYGHPFGWSGYWYSYGHKYDHLRLEAVIQKQTKKYLSTDPGHVCDICDHDGKFTRLREMSPLAERCRVAVLALPAENIQSVRILRSYQSRKASDSECYIWEALRATTASHKHFPQIICAHERFMGPDVGYMNPSTVAKDEVYKAFGHYDIQCLISIGNGKTVANHLAGHSTRDKGRSIYQYITTGNPEQLKVLQRLAQDCEHVHEGLSTDRSMKEKYFRFNLEADQGLWQITEWSQENKNKVLQKVGRTRREVALGTESNDDSVEPVPYLEDLNVQRVINDAIAKWCGPPSP